MSLKEQEYFLAIAEEQNITKAAQKLHVSQPSLTQQLQRTEKELGCELLIRTNSGVRLTEAGNAYFRMSRQMLQLFENFQVEIGQLKHMERGKLRIGASWYLSDTFLSSAVTQFAKRYPGIQIDCMENRTSILMEELAAGQVDLAVVSRYPHESDIGRKRLDYRPLYRDRFCVVAPPDFPLRREENYPWLDTETLQGQPLIMFHSNQRIREITDRVLARANITPQIRMTVYGFPIALAQVAAGVGIAILPYGYMASVQGQYNVQVFSLDPKLSAYWDIGIYSQHGEIMTFALKAFVEMAEKMKYEAVREDQNFVEDGLVNPL